jgi:hypothetical protein
VVQLQGTLIRLDRIICLTYLPICDPQEEEHLCD